MIRSLSMFCGVLALLTTLGCGQKGPLFLPPVDPQAASGSEPKGDVDPQPEADTEKPE